MSEKFKLILLVLAAMVLITVPYLVGFQTADQDHQFGGFLINPTDGNSYLAKMQQGFQGEWKFHLPYTAEPGEGAYLFLFYLGLGHLARILSLPLIFVFHAARVLAAGWVLFLIYQMADAIYERPELRMLGFALTVFGSGLGWIAVIFGMFTSDFWVAEAYPFLSMYTNPHFALGLGLMICALMPTNEDRIVKNLGLGLILGIIQPFGVVIISLVKVIKGLAQIVSCKFAMKDIIQKAWFWSLLVFSLTGGMIVLYQFWAILNDPVLALWHQQNITTRPGIFDLLISFSPLLILSLLGINRAWQSEGGKVMAIWGTVCLVLVFLPWSLQRRFLTGIYVPLALLSVFGLQIVKDYTQVKFNRWIVIVFFLALPTNLIVIISGLQAISERNPEIFFDRDLARSLDWIQNNTGEDDIILADEKNGLYVPALTGRRVIYGHPFETVYAEKEKKLLEEVFHNNQSDGFYDQFLVERQIDFVLIDGAAGRQFAVWLEKNADPAYQSHTYQIYSIK